MKEKYFITGATGFLGHWIVSELLNEKAEVHALVLPDDPLIGHIPHAVRITYGDVTDKDQVAAWLSKADEESIVIHAAGIISIASRPNPEMERVNIGGTLKVIQCCLKQKVGKLVYISSVHAIKERTRGIPHTEVTDFSPDKVQGQYAKTKAEATKLVLMAAENGLNATVVHPSGIIGPGDNTGSNITEMIRSYLAGTLPAGVKGGYDFVDVRDVARGVILAARRGNSGECYILSGHYKTIREVISCVAEHSRIYRKLIYVPIWLARLAAPFYERLSIRRGQKPFFTPYAIDVLASNGHFLHEKARLELGYLPRPLDETIRATLGWLAHKEQ